MKRYFIASAFSHSVIREVNSIEQGNLIISDMYNDAKVNNYFCDKLEIQVLDGKSTNYISR